MPNPEISKHNESDSFWLNESNFTCLIMFANKSEIICETSPTKSENLNKFYQS